MKSFQGRGNREYKGPEAGMEGVCARNSKEASEAKHIEQGGQEMGSKMERHLDKEGPCQSLEGLRLTLRSWGASAGL